MGTCREAGYRVTKGKRWHVQWGGMLEPDAYARLHAFQRVNHFPGKPSFTLRLKP